MSSRPNFRPARRSDRSGAASKPKRRELLVNFADGLSTSPTLQQAVLAIDAGQVAYKSGMYFGVDGAEYVVAIVTDVDGVDYSLVLAWEGSSLSPVHDVNWGPRLPRLLNLASQSARRATAS